jgi:Ala-tRNA(Pro) deacylase
MTSHPVKDQIIDALTQNACWFETFEHEPVRTSEEAAQVRKGYSLQHGAKAIIIRAKISGQGKKFLMLVIPADHKFDTGKVEAVLNARDIRFATPDEVEEITKGVKPGGVPPFGNLFGLEIVSDKRLYENEKIVFNAGERTFSIAMKSTDYLRLASPKVAEIV